MKNIKVTTDVVGMDAVEYAMQQAKEAADKLDDAVIAVKRAMRGLGVNFVQAQEPEADETP